MTDSAANPVVSVIMANFRGAAYLARSMACVLAQTAVPLELIVADDASDDDSVAIAQGIAARDPRVRVIASSVNAGPAVSRNLALDAARGEWVSVVDSDDLIHPDRTGRLIALARDRDADIVADDLVYFGAVPDPQGKTLLQSLNLTAPMVLTVADYLRANAGAGMPAYGYLKPLIRRRVLGARRYDPSLRIGEDYDLILRMLIDGARFIVAGDPLYAYRRHAGSISHRLTADAVAAMLAAHRSLPALTDPKARQAAREVDRQLDRALRYERLVHDIKARRWASALVRLADPAMPPKLIESLRDRRRNTAPPSGDVAPLPQPLPDLPAPCADWTTAPAPIAARIAKGARLPNDAPDWAQWLKTVSRADAAD